MKNESGTVINVFLMLLKLFLSSKELKKHMHVSNKLKKDFYGADQSYAILKTNTKDYYWK